MMVVRGTPMIRGVMCCEKVSNAEWLLNNIHLNNDVNSSINLPVNYVAITLHKIEKLRLVESSLLQISRLSVEGRRS
jgi:hypothetical protein